MQHGRGEHRLDGMADSVSEIDEIAQTRLAFVDSDNMRLDVDGTRHDTQKEGLSLGAVGFEAAGSERLRWFGRRG